MRRLAEQKRTVEQWRALEKNTADIGEMIEMAAEEADNSFTEEISADIAKLTERWTRWNWSWHSAASTIHATLFCRFTQGPGH